MKKLCPMITLLATMFPYYTTLAADFEAAVVRHLRILVDIEQPISKRCHSSMRGQRIVNSSRVLLWRGPNWRPEQPDHRHVWGSTLSECQRR